MLHANIPAWFEIPVADLDRAEAFYRAILDVDFSRQTVHEGELAVFPYAGKPNASGALMRHPQMAPSMDGTTVYLAVDDVAPVLARVDAHGGAVVVPRTALPEGMGVFAQFRDSEGNRVGLWSPQ